MAIRELVTALTFQADLSGLNQYNAALETTKANTAKAFDFSRIEAGLNKLKGVALGMTHMFGLTFAIGGMDQLASKIGEITQNVFNSAKEMNRLNGQLASFTKSSAEAKQVTDGLFKIAQEMAISYNVIAEEAKSFLAATSESKLSVADKLGALENFNKAMKVGKLNAEEQASAVGQLEQALRMNKFNPRSIGRLLEMPGVGKFLADALANGSEEGLRRLVKAGKLTAPKIIEALAKPNEKLDAEFSKVPVKLTAVFTKMNNELVRAASYVWKVTGGFSVLGNIIWTVFNTASSIVVGFVNALGGLQSTIELVGITLMVALGPLFLRQIILATASLVEMAVASWAVWAPWIAIGAAIVLAGLALQDMIIWMRGGPTKTVFGDMLGPFAEFRKSIEDFPLVKIFEGITKFFSGDFSSAWTSIKEGFTNIKTPADAFYTVLISIGGVFVAWEALTFFGIIGALTKLVTAFKGVKAEADLATTSIQRTANAANAPGAPVTTSGAPSVTPGAPGSPVKPRPPIARFGMGVAGALPFVLDATLLAQQAGIVPKLPEAAQDRLTTAATGATLGGTIGAGIGAIFGGIGAGPGYAAGSAIGAIGGALWPEVKQTGAALGALSDIISAFATRYGITLQSTNPSAEQAGVPSFGQMPSTLPPIMLPPGTIINTNPSAEQPSFGQTPTAPGTQVTPETHPTIMPFPSETSLVPRVTPFDSMTNATKTVENTVNAGGIIQNNNITVTAQMDEAQVAAAVQKQVEATTPALLDRVSRQLSDAIPLAERGTV